MLRSRRQSRHCPRGRAPSTAGHPAPEHPPGVGSGPRLWGCCVPSVPGAGGVWRDAGAARGSCHFLGLLPLVGAPGAAPLHGQGDGALRAAEPYLRWLWEPLLWESPLALTNLLQETPTHRTAEGAAVPFTALSPALQKTNERDYLTDTSLLSLSITCGFPSRAADSVNGVTDPFGQLPAGS